MMKIIIPSIIIIVGIFKFGVGGVVEKVMTAIAIIAALTWTYMLLNWIYRRVCNLFKRRS